MGLRPGKTKGPWVGTSGDGGAALINNSSSEFIDVFIGADGYAQFNVDHAFQSDFRYTQAFWASTDVLTGGDWNLTGAGLVGIGMVAAYSSFQKRVRDEFDVQGDFNQGGNTANPIGLRAAGAGQVAQITIEYNAGAHRIRTAFTGQVDVLTPITGSSWHLRIRRNQENQIRFYHRSASNMRWNQIANYVCDMEDNVELSLVTSTGNTVTELAFKATPWLGPRVFQLTDAATIAVDASRADKFEVTLGGNRQLGNPTNPAGDGQLILFRIRQDGTGSRILTYDTLYRFSTGLPSPTLSTGANALDYLGFAYNKTDGRWDYIAQVMGF